MIHEMKVGPESFEDVKSGKVNFDIRKNDRNYKAGDVLIFSEYGPDGKGLTGEQIEKTICNIIQHKKGLCKGFVVLAWGDKNGTSSE